MRKPGCFAECEKRPQRGGKKYLADLVRFAVNTGMREREIMDLAWQRVNIKERCLHVTDTKNHEGRFVPVNDTVAAILRRRRPAGSAYVFSKCNGGRLTVLTNAFWTAVAAAGT